MRKHSYVDPLSRLRHAKLRPTRQRIGLVKLLFDGGHRHVTAEKLYEEALRSEVQVSLATVYNTLHLFCAAGLLREVAVERRPSFFDTNTSDHHHFLHVETGTICDIPASAVRFNSLPAVPAGTEIDRVDVTIRLHWIN